MEIVPQQTQPQRKLERFDWKEQVCEHQIYGRNKNKDRIFLTQRRINWISKYAQESRVATSQHNSVRLLNVEMRWAQNAEAGSLHVAIWLKCAICLWFAWFSTLNALGSECSRWFAFCAFAHFASHMAKCANSLWFTALASYHWHLASRNALSSECNWWLPLHFARWLNPSWKI